jgi:hypothetical protein
MSGHPQLLANPAGKDLEEASDLKGKQTFLWSLSHSRLVPLRDIANEESNKKDNKK